MTDMSGADPERRIAILSGLQGSGKTTLCRRLVEEARVLGLDCAGILGPAQVEAGAKVGIDIEDVRTGERRALAAADDLPARLRLGPWRFDDEAVAWGRARLDDASPCDVLFVDEIGPLELNRGEGFTNALEVLRSGDYRLAVAVVRPALVDEVRTRLGARAGRIAVTVCQVPGDAGARGLARSIAALASREG
jgi:nucleoside-triphosphatase